MPTGKTSTLTSRFEPALKERLRTAAVKQHRSIANMIAVMIQAYCGRNGASIPETGARDTDRKKVATGSNK